MLFGFMGTGKSAVGRLLGERLHRPVVEMDEIIEEREGMSISRLFIERGEAYFRKRERALAEELSRRRGQIVATGGGVVLDPDNIRDFAWSGLLVCLTARPEVILKRVENESHRPLLEKGDRLETIRRMLDDRRIFYDRIEYRIDTSDLSVDQIVRNIISHISSSGEDTAVLPYDCRPRP